MNKPRFHQHVPASPAEAVSSEWWPKDTGWCQQLLQSPEKQVWIMFSGKEHQGKAHKGDVACLINGAVVHGAKVSEDLFATISQTITTIIITTTNICRVLSMLSDTVVSTLCILTHLTFTL